MKKKIFAIICSICLLISMMPTAAFAADNVYSAPTLSIQVEHDKDAKTVTAYVKLGMCSDLGGLDFHLQYDTSKFTLKNYNGTDEFANEDYTTISSNEDNLGLSFVKSSGLTLDAEKTILTAVFEVKEGAYGKATFGFDSAVTNFAHKDGNATASTPAEGSTTTTSIILYKEALTTATVSVAAPVKNVELAKTADISSATAYTASVQWYEGETADGDVLSDEVAKAGQIYTAKVTLTAKADEGENFALGESFIAPKGWKVVSNDGTFAVLTQTFPPTETRTVQSLTVTTEPTKKEYTHGDPFDATGITVKATFDDATVDEAYTAYTVAYETEEQTYLKRGNTKVTLKAGEASAEVTGLTVNPKELTITGLIATDRKYEEGKMTVELSGGELTGIVGNEVVTVTMPTTGTIADANVGVDKEVTVTKPELEGTDKGNYTLAAITGVKVNITPADIPDGVKNAITGYGKAYDGDIHDAVVIEAGTTDYTIKYSDTENGTYDSNNPQVTNVSDSKTVWVEISRANYATVKKSVKAVIKPKALTLKSATATARDYEKDNVDVEISAIAFNEPGTLPELNTGFTATGKMNDDNAGDSKTVTVTVNLTDGNYSLEVPTTTTTVKINKINYAGTKTANGEAKYGTSGTVDLTSMLAEGGTFGAITKTDEDDVLSEEPTVSEGKLNFTFANESSKATKTATVKVRVTSTNYIDYDIEVTLKVLDKLPQSDFKFENPAQTKVYGNADFTVKAKGAVSGSTVTYESSAPDVATVDNDGKVHILKASTTDVTITATASATDEYQSATATYTLKINKAKITITAKNQKIYVNGTVPDLTNPVKDTHYEVAGLVGTDALGGTLEMKYSKDSSDVAVADVDVTKIGTYDIIISGATAPTGGNYEDEIAFINGTLTIETKPSSGGGSSYVPSTSTEKAAKDFVKNSMTAGGSAIKNVSKDNYKQVLEAAEKYSKLSAAEKAAVDKEMKAQTGKTMAELTAEAEAIKASVEEPTVDDKTIQDAVKDLAIKARSAKLKSGKIKVTLTGDLSALEKEGYTVKYKFYRSTKKSASYKAAVTKDAPEYLNTAGKKGTMYYYKARVMVYDKDGKLVAQSELKQCKYANRKWTK